MKHDHSNQTLFWEGEAPANNPGTPLIVLPKPAHVKRTPRLADLPGQEAFWGDGAPMQGTRCTTLECHWSITEDTLIKVLTKAANAATKRFGRSIPSSMTRGDFRQEIIARMYKEAIRWRDTGKQKFERYVMTTAYNRARDILRADQLKDSAHVTENQIIERANELGYDPNQLTARQRKNVVNGLRKYLVQYVGEFHVEPTVAPDEPEEDDDEMYLEDRTHGSATA